MPADLNIEADEVECCNLERSYRRGPKGTGDKKTGKEKLPAGICHLCLGGKIGYDWEDLCLVDGDILTDSLFGTVLRSEVVDICIRGKRHENFFFCIFFLVISC